MPTDNERVTIHARPTIANALSAYENIEQSINGARDIRLHHAGGGFFSRFTLGRDPVISPTTAIHLARGQLKQAVLESHGELGWQILKNRIPELRQDAVQVNMARLASKIQATVTQLDITGRVNRLISKDMFGANTRIDHLQARYRDKPHLLGPAIAKATIEANAEQRAATFDDYEKVQANHVEELIKEFGPPGEAWDVAAELAGLTQPLTADERGALSIMLGASIRQHLRDEGKLPNRARLLDMAVEHANTHAGNGLEKSDQFASRPEFSVTAPGALLGRADFPTPALQAEVQALAQRIQQGTAKDKDGAPLRDNGKDPVLLQAMRQVHGVIGKMLEGHSQFLAARMAEIDGNPMSPGPSPFETSELMKEVNKLALFMPGSKLFDLLQAQLPEPRLGPQALNGFKREMLQTMRNPAAMSDIAFRALSAYANAQELEKARALPRDPTVLAAICADFRTDLADQIRSEGKLETVILAKDSEVRQFEQNLRNRETPMHENGYSAEFFEDVNRTSWRLHQADGGTEVVTTSGRTKEEALARYQAFFAGEEQAGKTLSGQLHQNAIGLIASNWMGSCCSADDLNNENAQHFMLLMDQHPLFRERLHEVEYELKKLPAGKVLVTYHYLKAADNLLVATANPVPINRSGRFDGPVSEKNAAVQQVFRFVYDMKDLRAGVVKPVALGHPATELRIRPDWGQIEAMRQDGNLTGLINRYNAEQGA
jgi:hypothetical protein